MQVSLYIFNSFVPLLLKISGLSDHSTWKYSVYWFSGNRVFPRFWGQFSPEFSPDGGASEWVSEAGLDAGLDGKGPVQLRGGGAFRRRIQVGIDVRSGREIAVAEPLLDIFHGNTVFQKQRGAGMPLWHNKDKSETPCGARSDWFVLILFPTNLPQKIGVTREAKKRGVT